MGAVTEASRLYREALDALSDQRSQIEEDLAFSDPSDPDQWDATELEKRRNDPGGARPCLVFDQTSQYVTNVAGQIEQRPPAIHAIPVADGADAKAAEQLDGLMRYIEYASRAQAHYMRALTSAARVGAGYLIVRPQTTDRAMNWQEPRIGSEGDPLKIVFDPWSQELDGSDANFGFALSPISKRSFAKAYPKADAMSFGDDAAPDTEREEVLLAEYWRVDESDKNMVRVAYPDGDEASMTVDDYQKAQAMGSPMQLVRAYRDKHRCVYWSLMSGAEVLAEERIYPSSYIGIIPVYGYVGWSDGRMTYCGIPRRAREPQRAYNYHMSEIRAVMQMAPKAPWLVPVEGIIDETVKNLWDRASIESRAWLPYRSRGDDGQPIPPPQRMPLAVNLSNHTQGAEQALRDIQASIGMYQASLGAPSNETSGIAINERKQQGEASTAHFPAHLSASLSQVGRVCIEMLPRLIDSRRQLRVLSIDSQAATIVADPAAKQAWSDQGGEMTLNPNIGRYDVRVVVGGNFATQRQQAQQAYTEMMRAAPQMMPAIAPLWAQTLDVPHADKLAQVLTAMAPPAVQAILNPNPQDDTATLKAQIGQLSEALQEAVQHAQEAQMDADEAQQKLAAAESKSDVEEDRVAVQAYDAQTKRMQALSTAIPPEQVPALVQKTIAEMLEADSPWPGEQEMQPEATEEPEESEEADPAITQVAEQQAQIIEGQQQVLAALQSLAQAVQRPRKRIPVRGPDGLIQSVMDAPDEQPMQGTIQ